MKSFKANGDWNETPSFVMEMGMMDSSLSDDHLARIKADLVAGRKIDAIKHYRNSTGKGLAEAVQTIEVLEAELHGSEPGQFQTKPPSTAGMIAFGLIGVPCLLWGLWSLGNAAALSAFGVRDEGKLTEKHEGWLSSEIFGRVAFDPVQKTVEITGRSRFGGAPQHPRKGSRIPVVYWAGQPETARWNSFGVLYFPNLILLGVGFLFTLASWAFWARARRTNASGAVEPSKPTETHGRGRFLEADS